MKQKLQAAFESAKTKLSLEDIDRARLQRGLSGLSTALRFSPFRNAGYLALGASLALSAYNHYNPPEENRGVSIDTERVVESQSAFAQRLHEAASDPGVVRRDGSIEVHDPYVLEYIDHLRENSDTFRGIYDEMVESGFPVRVTDYHAATEPHPEDPVGWVHFVGPDGEEAEDRAEEIEIVIDWDYLFHMIDNEMRILGVSQEEIDEIKREEMFRTIVHEFAHAYDVAVDQGSFERYCSHEDPDTGWSCTRTRENQVAHELQMTPSIEDSLPMPGDLLDAHRAHHDRLIQEANPGLTP